MICARRYMQDMMKTAAGREVALHRHLYMLKFLDRFNTEWGDAL